MRRVVTIAQRELVAIFLSPIAYIVVAIFLTLNGYMFWLILGIFNRSGGMEGSPFAIFLGAENIFAWIFILLTAPAITMRLFAEERQRGTIETLFTAPVTEAQVVVGKFLAAYVFYLSLWLPTVLYAGILFKYSSPDWRPMLTGYLGVALLGAMFIAVGEFTSALTRNQIVAYMAAAACLLGLFLGGLLLPMQFKGETASRILEYFNLYAHVREFGQGIVDSRHVVYYLSVTVFTLFVTTRAIESRKWR
jgi:ABC-2 type transport system permease protein